MPLKQLLINCTHYWILFALFNGIELFFFPKGHTYDQPILIAIVVAWAFFEFCNLQCHLQCHLPCHLQCNLQCNLQYLCSVRPFEQFLRQQYPASFRQAPSSSHHHFLTPQAITILSHLKSLIFEPIPISKRFCIFYIL